MREIENALKPRKLYSCSSGNKERDLLFPLLPFGGMQGDQGSFLPPGPGKPPDVFLLALTDHEKLNNPDAGFGYRDGSFGGLVFYPRPDLRFRYNPAEIVDITALLDEWNTGL